jgi:hypothetical protein
MVDRKSLKAARHAALARDGTTRSLKRLRISSINQQPDVNQILIPPILHIYITSTILLISLFRIKLLPAMIDLSFL